MTKPPRLDAPPADLRPLDRGTITKSIGCEPRLTFPKQEPVFKRAAAAEAETAEKLTKAAQAPAPADLAKSMKTMADLANIALKAAERSEAAARRIEAALAEKSTPSLKTALAKADFAKKRK